MPQSSNFGSMTVLQSNQGKPGGKEKSTKSTTKKIVEDENTTDCYIINPCLCLILHHVKAERPIPLFKTTDYY